MITEPMSSCDILSLFSIVIKSQKLETLIILSVKNLNTSPIMAALWQMLVI